MRTARCVCPFRITPARSLARSGAEPGGWEIAAVGHRVTRHWRNFQHLVGANLQFGRSGSALRAKHVWWLRRGIRRAGVPFSSTATDERLTRQKAWPTVLVLGSRSRWPALMPLLVRRGGLETRLAQMSGKTAAFFTVRSWVQKATRKNFTGLNDSAYRCCVPVY